MRKDGVKTTSLPPGASVDEVLAHKDGSLVPVAFELLAAQLAGSGALYEGIEEIKSLLSGGGGEYADTKDDLDAIAGSANDTGWVLRDPTTVHNGIYKHTGAIWQKVIDLPAGWQALTAEDIRDLYESNANRNALTDELLAKLQGLQSGASQVFRTETGPLSTALTGDASERLVYEGGSIQTISGYGKARVVTGADIAAAGTSLQLAFADLIPVYPNELTHVAIYVVRTVDAVDPAGHAVEIGFNRLLAGKQIAAETIVDEITDLVVVDPEDLGAGVRKIEFSVTKSGDFDDAYSLADNVSYINPWVKFHGPGGNHAVAWIAQVVSDHTHALLPEDRDHLISDEERADIAADKARIGVLEAQQLHRVIANPLPGEQPVATYDPDLNQVEFCRLRFEVIDQNGYAPTFSRDGGTFAHPGGNETSVLALDLESRDLIVTDLDTAADLTRYFTVFELSPAGITSARGIPVAVKDEGELTTSYLPALDSRIAQGQPNVEQYAPRFVHTEADKFWFAPAARQGQKIILRLGAVFDLTSVPLGVTVEYYCSAAAALYAGFSHEDESQIGFGGMDDGGDSPKPLNHAALTAGQWGFISRHEPGVINISWMDRDSPPVFTNIDHPTADLHIVGVGQSPFIEFRNKGGLGGLQRGLAEGFRMEDPNTGDPAPFTGTLYFSPAAFPAAAIDSRNATGDAYYRNGVTEAFDGAAAIEYRRVIDLAHARGQPCPSALMMWWGARDVTSMATEDPPIDMAQLEEALADSIVDMRNYCVTKDGWNDLPTVMLSVLQLNEKAIASEDDVAVLREDVTTRVRAMQLDLINDPARPWIVQGPPNYAFERGLGQAHHTYHGHDQWGLITAPYIGNVCLGQDNDFISKLESYEIAEDRGSITFTFTEPLGHRFRKPSGIGGSHYSTAPAPFLIGVLNAARQVIPATAAQWLGDRKVQIWLDLPAEGVNISAIFPYGSSSLTALGEDCPGTIISRGGQIDPASGRYVMPAEPFFRELT